MIVFMDLENKQILLYNNNGLIKIPFAKCNLLKNYGNNFTYITNAIETQADDIINLIKSTGIPIENIVSKKRTGCKYIHSNLDEKIIIDSSLIFEGITDCRLIDMAMKNKIEESKLLQKLLVNKKLSIIDEDEKCELDKIKKERRKEILEKQGKKDKQTGSIIKDIKIKKGDKSIIIDDSNEEEDNENEIPILEGKVEGNFQTMSELFKKIEETNE